MTGYYYLHTDGNLIFKRFCPDPSDFVRKIWPVDISNRASAWKIILEALALKGNVNKIKELSEKWNCDLKDLVEYIVRTKPSNLEIDGLKLYFENIAMVDYNKWMDWLAATPKGDKPDWENMPKADGCTQNK